MRAIICAAGFGSRMYPLAQDKPKCLLLIQEETLLGRQIRLLKECGVSGTTVVTGHMDKQIVEMFKDQVHFCPNLHYSTTNSLYSVWSARDHLIEDTIITNADVLFTKESLERLISNTNTYCLLIGGKDCDEEDHKVRIDKDGIVEVNKTMIPESAFGEFIGLAKVGKEGLLEFKNTLLEKVQENPQAFWVSVFQRLIEKEYKVYYALAQKPWIEIDTKEDYEEAKKIRW